MILVVPFGIIVPLLLLGIGVFLAFMMCSKNPCKCCIPCYKKLNKRKSDELIAVIEETEELGGNAQKYSSGDVPNISAKIMSTKSILSPESDDMLVEIEVPEVVVDAEFDAPTIDVKVAGDVERNEKPRKNCFAFLIPKSKKKEPNQADVEVCGNINVPLVEVEVDAKVAGNGDPEIGGNAKPKTCCAFLTKKSGPKLEGDIESDGALDVGIAVNVGADIEFNKDLGGPEMEIELQAEADVEVPNIELQVDITNNDFEVDIEADGQ